MLTTSAEIDQISAALSAALPGFKPIVKNKWNPHFESHYADLAQVRGAVKEALHANGLFVLQSPDSKGSLVTITMLIAHKSGQWIRGDFSAEARNAQAQSVGAATTTLCRYQEAAMLGLEIDDDDGNATQKTDQPDEGGGGDTDEIYNNKNTAHQDRLIGELKRRNVPDDRWDVIGKWLDGKSKTFLSKAIVSA